MAVVLDREAKIETAAETGTDEIEMDIIEIGIGIGGEAGRGTDEEAGPGIEGLSRHESITAEEGQCER